MSGTAAIQYENTPTLAARLGVHPETVRRWVRAGTIPYIRIGGVVRFDPAETDRWAAERTVDNTGVAS